MGMTMTQKILARAAGLDSVCAGQLIEANLDLVLGNDITSPVAIKEMDKFDYLLFEASGICEPIPIAQTICALEDAYEEYKMPKLCYLDGIVSVVDAKRLLDNLPCLVKTNLEVEEANKIKEVLKNKEVYTSKENNEIAIPITQNDNKERKYNSHSCIKQI